MGLTKACAAAVIALFPITQIASAQDTPAQNAPSQDTTSPDATSQDAPATTNVSTAGTSASGGKYYYHDGHAYKYRWRGGYYNWHTSRGYYKVRYACGAGWCYR